MTSVYQSKFYTLYQSNTDRYFYIDFGQKVVKLSFCQLLALRQKVNSIAIETHFDADLNKHGFELLMLCNKEHLFLLNTLEILDLKNLVCYGFALLGISSENAKAVY
ncbi:hypothetical protein [Arenibacter certesii]|uniref:Uncharacterized protein n=1 Tax=Arenibacter certesii TaxID=228955 RepID=A0A918J4M2_9FLAO|nr:hypothetical protein [Arenibacter certesii]GGW47358.1 hypothetical protein GCM10007383_34340 [Arenibacter certesii]